MDIKATTIKDINMSWLELPLIMLYNHPEDYPDKIVARVWEGRTVQPTNVIILYDSISAAEKELHIFSRLEKSPEDDPFIICTYIP